MRYNCTIIDLYDRSVVATLNSSYINTELAINTLKRAIKNEPPGAGLILHSDQGCQFSSWKFVDYCKSQGIIQSMSKAGCPYDNAPMERFYKTFKDELVYRYHSEFFEQSVTKMLDQYISNIPIVYCLVCF